MLSACRASLPPLATVDHVDIDRFMGDWYVIANIPTFIEKEAYNAVESYRLRDDGTIATTFRFRKGGFDGPLKEYRPRGFVRDDPSNAVWGMQFIWPIKADYRITWLDENYTHTVISRKQRDYVWIMARTPVIPEGLYLQLVGHVQQSGYDVTQLRRVPQRWESTGSPP
ncbi:lipocalin family protein [Wenzhouxiangellaceae bacterium CH-27]|uniref:Outer membrane lipoprotein Blc n=1 Tax=Elongatibacter sediminis TaxID=3119006 RepID=A0AAW9RGW4_9GAMM